MSVAAIALPCSIACAKARAARGWAATQDASAPYPLTGKSWLAPVSMSASSVSPYFSAASVTYGSTS